MCDLCYEKKVCPVQKESLFLEWLFWAVLRRVQGMNGRESVFGCVGSAGGRQVSNGADLLPQLHEKQHYLKNTNSSAPPASL